jgi:hypothetical protein
MMSVLLYYRNVGQCFTVTAMLSLPSCLLLLFSAALLTKFWSMLLCGQDVVPAMRPVTDATGSHCCSVTKMLPVLHFH